jgi:hypothetical protein
VASVEANCSWLGARQRDLDLRCDGPHYWLKFKLFLPLAQVQQQQQQRSGSQPPQQQPAKPPAATQQAAPAAASKASAASSTPSTAAPAAPASGSGHPGRGSATVQSGATLASGAAPTAGGQSSSQPAVGKASSKPASQQQQQQASAAAQQQQQQQQAAAAAAAAAAAQLANPYAAAGMPAALIQQQQQLLMARQLMAQPAHLPLNRLTAQQSQQLAASYQQAQRPQQALHPSLMGQAVYPPAAAMQVGRGLGHAAPPLGWGASWLCLPLKSACSPPVGRLSAVSCSAFSAWLCRSRPQQIPKQLMARPPCCAGHAHAAAASAAGPADPAACCGSPAGPCHGSGPGAGSGPARCWP